MLAVRLPEEMEKKLNRYKEKLEKSKSQIVKEALQLYFTHAEEKEKPSPYALGKELFGKYASGRDDLSENYKQLLKEKLREKYRAHR